MSADVHPHRTTESEATRRAFLQQLGLTLTASGLAVAGAPSLLSAAPFADVTSAGAADDFDMTWTARVTGKHKAVFDSPDIAGGLGVIRGAVVKKQYMDAFKIAAADFTTVIVLRHDGIALAMNQQFWDTYGIAKSNNVKHPWTGEPITKNPATLTPADGLPATLAGADLASQLKNGAIALACNLAFGDMVDLVAKTDKLSDADARKKALGMMMPGVIMQPSGVFATTVAQEKGCVYVRAT
ncbi:MAG: hypothetical protein K2R93_02765 [Gemmatimonadaceae bacterium]|nr:hypothetical protein [Gemmatimonadaceae bacterium]